MLTTTDKDRKHLLRSLLDEVNISDTPDLAEPDLRGEQPRRSAKHACAYTCAIARLSRHNGGKSCSPT
jgi:hypothetical protein